MPAGRRLSKTTPLDQNSKMPSILSDGLMTFLVAATDHKAASAASANLDDLSPVTRRQQLNPDLLDTLQTLESKESLCCLRRHMQSTTGTHRAIYL